MKNKSTSTVEPPPPTTSAPPPKSLASIFGRIIVGLIRTIPTALYGGVAAIACGFYTDTFDSNEYGVVIVDRFIEGAYFNVLTKVVFRFGAYFNVLTKVVFRFLVPLITGWNPGPIYGAGLQGACLGYYFGSYGRRRSPFECCMIVSSMSMLTAVVLSVTC
ncbi:unnamed protein product [Allacma fusca]|uniref:Uncharacterized protein n=1 Tax=Allacma fusca TaxID=39272 RepID=A0A8J2PTF4_9HEXA|nr:unnamed protein product [Allacma fusca]